MDGVIPVWQILLLVVIAFTLSNIPEWIRTYKASVKAKDDEKWAKRKATLRATQAKEKSLEQKVEDMGLMDG